MYNPQWVAATKVPIESGRKWMVVDKSVTQDATIIGRGWYTARPKNRAGRARRLVER